MSENIRFQNDWGQGSSTNSIGWGQGAGTNSIGWGLVHRTSWNNPTTDLVGLTEAQRDFKDRVLLDNGIVEALSCVIIP